MVGEYGPRKIHRNVQTGTDLFAVADLWLCTTCGNCLRVCPKRVDMIAIMPAVREAALSSSAVPAELQDVFEKTFRLGNALGQSQRRRRSGQRAPGFLCESWRATRRRSTCSSMWRTTGASTLVGRTPPGLSPGGQRSWN